MTSDNQRSPQEQRARNRKQGWLYIVIGVLLGSVAVLGLLADDRGFLDWALLLLAIANLVIGALALRSPEPRISEPRPDEPPIEARPADVGPIDEPRTDSPTDGPRDPETTDE